MTLQTILNGYKDMMYIFFSSWNDPLKFNSYTDDGRTWAQHFLGRHRFAHEDHQEHVAQMSDTLHLHPLQSRGTQQPERQKSLIIFERWSEIDMTYQ